MFRRTLKFQIYSTLVPAVHITFYFDFLCPGSVKSKHTLDAVQILIKIPMNLKIIYYLYLTVFNKSIPKDSRLYYGFKVLLLLGFFSWSILFLHSFLFNFGIFPFT